MDNENYMNISNLRDYSNIDKLQNKLNSLSSKTLEKNYKRSIESSFYDIDYLNQVSDVIIKLLNSDDEYIYDRLYSEKNNYEYNMNNISNLDKKLKIEDIYSYYRDFSKKEPNLNIENVFNIRLFDDKKIDLLREKILNNNFSETIRLLRKIREKNSDKDKKLKKYLFNNENPDLYKLRIYESNKEEFKTLDFYINGIIDYKYISFDLPLIFNHETLNNIFENLLKKKIDNPNDNDIKNIFENRNYGLYYVFDGFDILKVIDKKMVDNKGKLLENTISNILKTILNNESKNLNDFIDCLISIINHLYNIEKDKNKQEYLENTEKSIKNFKKYLENVFKNGGEKFKDIFEYKEENYKDSNGENLMMGVMPLNKELGLVIFQIYKNTLKSIYDLYLKNYQFLDTIIKKSSKSVYHSMIQNMKNNLEKIYEPLIQPYSNNKELNIETVSALTEIKESYDLYLDEYKENLKELLYIQKSINKNKTLFQNTEQLKVLSNEYNRYLSNALSFKYRAIFYKKLVLLMFYDYKNKNPGSSAFSDTKSKILKDFFEKSENKIKRINKESLKNSIENKLKQYLENPEKLNSLNMEIERLVKQKQNIVDIKLNKINKELEYYEDDNNDNVKLNKSFSDKLKKLTENNDNNDNSLSIKIKSKIKKSLYWKKLKEDYLDGNTLYVIFKNKNNYGLFNILESCIKGKILKSHFILDKKLNKKLLKKLSNNGLISIGLIKENISKWRCFNIKYIKKIQNLKDDKLRYELFNILSNKTNYKKIFNEYFGPSYLKDLIVEVDDSELYTNQNDIINYMNKILK